MPKDEFYVEDEPIGDAQHAWREGEKGVTKGKRDLNQAAKSVVDQAVERLDQALPVEATTASVLSITERRTLQFGDVSAARPVHGEVSATA